MTPPFKELSNTAKPGVLLAGSSSGGCRGFCLGWVRSQSGREAQHCLVSCGRLISMVTSCGNKERLSGNA